jgi:predicted nucleic acid-binding protein
VIDTSVWVDFLRRGRSGRSGRLDGLLEADSALVCGPVAAELLAGAPAAQRAELWELLGGLDWAPLGFSQWRKVGDVAAALRERGATVPLTDVEIAVAAVDSESALWSWDGDFDRIGEVLTELRRFAG